ncbi:MAG: hypothetical protein KDB27_07670 [Planctomycetales bacterium]|nr:hypothetical protein [Planctomycetales bacterium]
MFRIKHRKSSPKRQTGIETLETRQLLAGDAFCFSFDNLPLEFSGVVGSALTTPFEPAAHATLEPFVTEDGNLYVDGFAEIQNGEHAATGQELHLNNINLSVSGAPAAELTFNYADLGGNINLEVNGSFQNVNDLIELDGQTLGGANVIVTSNTVTITGHIESMTVGGQEFYIDNFCGVPKEGAEPDQEAFDFGDAPDPYPTLLSNNGAIHAIKPGVHLGDRVDAEVDGQPNSNATGDDSQRAYGLPLDDEDGIQFATPLVPGQQASIDVTASVDGYLSMWLDYNRDANWTGPDDAVFIGQVIPAGVSTITFTVPTTATPDASVPTFARFRFSDEQAVQRASTDLTVADAPTGEVEDYAVLIVDQVDELLYDFGDARDDIYPTTKLNNGPYHRIEGDVALGTVDAEPNGISSLHARGDDLTDHDDEDGVTFTSAVIPGTTATVDVFATVDGWLNAWIDWGRDGFDTQDRVFGVHQLTAGTNSLEIDVPQWASVNQLAPTTSRWRFSTSTPLLGPSHGTILGHVLQQDVIPNGEVEDHHVMVVSGERPQLDFGDAGNSYRTLAANNGPRHIIDPAVHLGNRIDAETDGQPSAAADGDDVIPNFATSDEDGVIFQSAIVPGGVTQVDVLASVDGTLTAWIDFNTNGQFEQAETIFSAEPLSGGVNQLSFQHAVPAFRHKCFCHRSSRAEPATHETGIDGEIRHCRPKYDGSGPSLSCHLRFR